MEYLYKLENISLNYYSRENRTIKEQVLNLSTAQKQQLFNYLENNYKPENRKYLYDFFYDNCATKIRDVLSTVTNNSITFENGNATNYSALNSSEVSGTAGQAGMVRATNASAKVEFLSEI